METNITGRKKGISSGSCPIAVINYENQRRKTLVDQLSSAVTAYSKNNAVVSRTLIETLKELSGFLPDHIWKEDYLLLPMADKILSEEDKRSLADSLHRIESQKGEEARRTADQFNAMLHRCMDNIGHATEAYVG
jgi:hemerythrin-like domain-containing protein